MSYNKKDIFFSNDVNVIYYFISNSIHCLFKQLYYLDINYLGIDLTSGMSVETIKKNYDVFNCISVDLLSGERLNLPDFCNVKQTVGFIFEEVKTIF